MGHSNCTKTINCQNNTSYFFDNSRNCEFTSSSPHTSLGAYFICGTFAHPWLPWDWFGSCMTPAIWHLLSLPAECYRERRAISECERFAAVMFPMKEIGLLAIIFDTSGSFDQLATEMTTIHTGTPQNRLALDFIFANKDGMCALFGKECCTYIPDNSEIIYDWSEHIKKEAAKAKQANNWHMWSSFKNIFENLGWFGKKILYNIISILPLLVILYVHSGLIPNMSSPMSPWLTEVQKNIAKGEAMSEPWLWQCPVSYMTRRMQGSFHSPSSHSLPKP